MFQLIVAIISIALIAALAAASIFYGGSAFTDSSLKANVTTLVNGGQQISGAQAIYKTDNAGAPQTDIALLADGTYLAAVPTPANIASGPWVLSEDGTHAVIPLTAGEGADKVCELVSTQNNGATAAGTDATDMVVTGGTYACDAIEDAAFFAFKL